VAPSGVEVSTNSPLVALGGAFGASGFMRAAASLCKSEGSFWVSVTFVDPFRTIHATPAAARINRITRGNCHFLPEDFAISGADMATFDSVAPVAGIGTIGTLGET